MENTTIRLANRPDRDIADDTFQFGREPVPALRDGDIQVAIEYVSIDPTMRTWVSDFESYIPPVALGDVMRAGAAGEVIASRTPEFSVGNKVLGLLGVQSIYTGSAKNVSTLDTEIAPIKSYLGGLGGTGLAAYFGLLRVGAMTTDETVVISTAAGAVGHVAVQIAKLKGNRVIGIAGGPEKCRRVVDHYGADACIDYKSEDVGAELGKHCPKGIDVYFDNVGGTMLENALDNLAMGARIVICGAISDYNNLETIHAPRNYLNLIGKGARMEGLLNIHWKDQNPQARAEMQQWVADGQLVFEEQIERGIENFPAILKMLFRGQNNGKLLLRV
ncbi:MAG: NADP-dependent oxidoreductase [Pseudomonadota bacterium]